MELLAGVASVLFGLFMLFMAVGIVVSGAPMLLIIVPLALAAVFFKWAYDLLVHPQGL